MRADKTDKSIAVSVYLAAAEGGGPAVSRKPLFRIQLREDRKGGFRDTADLLFQGLLRIIGSLRRERSADGTNDLCNHLGMTNEICRGYGSSACHSNSRLSSCVVMGMFQPHHFNSHLQSERDLCDKLDGIRCAVSLGGVVNPASALPGVDEKVSGIEVSHSTATDDRSRPFDRWYVTILAVVAAGAAVAAFSYTSESVQKTLASLASR